MSKGPHREALTIVLPEICQSALPQPQAAAPDRGRVTLGNGVISIVHGLPHLLPSLVSPRILSILQQKLGKLAWGPRPEDSPLLSCQDLPLCSPEWASEGCSRNPKREMEPWLGPKAARLSPGRPVLLLWVSALSVSVSSLASPSPSPGPRIRTSYNLGRTFLGLDKCNACIGTSICKKFFKEEIRSESPLDNLEGRTPVPFAVMMSRSLWGMSRDAISGWEPRQSHVIVVAMG